MQNAADLVGAPAGEVDPPVVQLQLDVSGSVGAIEAHETALRDTKDGPLRPILPFLTTLITFHFLALPSAGRPW